MQTIDNKGKLECLEFFDYCDVITGEKLQNIEQLEPINIIPSEWNPSIDTLYNYAYTCINIHYHLLDWFQQQEIFNEDRFLKLCEWMSQCDEYSYMNKYKILPKSQLRYMDVFDESESFRQFKIICPNGYSQTMYSSHPNKNMSNNQLRQKRMYQVEDCVIEPNITYVTKNWIDTKKGSASTSRFLDRCADYVLQGELDYEGNMAYQKYEVPASNYSNAVMTTLEYGDNNGNFVENIEYIQGTHYEYTKEICDTLKNDKRRKRVKTRLSKLSKILPNDYHAEWQYVWSDGTFTFDNTEFKIDIAEHSQYLDLSKTKIKGSLSVWSMDKILCVKTNNGYIFIDMNIEPLSHISKIE